MQLYELKCIKQCILKINYIDFVSNGNRKQVVKTLKMSREQIFYCIFQDINFSLLCRVCPNFGKILTDFYDGVFLKIFHDIFYLKTQNQTFNRAGNKSCMNKFDSIMRAHSACENKYKIIIMILKICQRVKIS